MPLKVYFDRIAKNISPPWVIFSVAVGYVALLVLQVQLSFFSPTYDKDRFPSWAPFAYSSIRELLDQEKSKNWVLIGDSVVHGDNTIREETIGTRLSREQGFVNLSNPSLSFQIQSLLIQAIEEEYPQKKILLQINPKWIAYSWTPDKFQPFKMEFGARIKQNTLARELFLKNESSPSYRKYRVLFFLTLDLLRAKIQYRWLNEHLSAKVNRWISKNSKTLADHPFLTQENIIKARGFQIHPVDRENQLSELRRLYEDKNLDLEKNEAFSALFDVAKKSTGTVFVVIIPVNPDLINDLTVTERAISSKLTSNIEDRLNGAGIQTVRLNIKGTMYTDSNHLSPEGHQVAYDQIATFLRKFQ